MAVFPKNLVWRHSDNSLRALRNYIAAFPEFRVQYGELFVVDTYEEPEEVDGLGRVSVMTRDPFHLEMASALGTLPQIADSNVLRRQWAYQSTLMYQQSRSKLVYDEQEDEDVPQPYGDGWTVVNPFPYDLSANVLDDFYDVNTFLTGVNEGDNLHWVLGENGRYYYVARAGLGDPENGIAPSANLDNSRYVRYNQPIGANSKLIYNASDNVWENRFDVPTLANRDDVDLDTVPPVSDDALSYNEAEDTWGPKPVAQEGVLLIPDGSKSIDKSRELYVITGQEFGQMGTGDVGEDPQYTRPETARYISAPTELNPDGRSFVYEKNTSRIKSQANSPTDFWDRFPEGAWYFRSFFDSVSGLQQLQRLDENIDPELASGVIERFTLQDIQTTKASLFTNTSIYQGDFTVSCWFRMDEDFIEEWDPTSTRPKPEYESHEILSIGANSTGTFSSFVAATQTVDRFGGLGFYDYPVRGDLQFTFRGVTNTLVQDIRGGVDYHLTVQYSEESRTMKVWLNGILMLCRLVEGATILDWPWRTFRVGYNFYGWMADAVFTLQPQYDTEFKLISTDTQREFTPPINWSHKLVDGPKAAIKTLGVTKTGYFSWISQENPFNWKTAFARNQFNTFSQQLAMGSSAMANHDILSWDATQNKFVAGKSPFGGSEVKKIPGQLGPNMFRLTLDPQYLGQGQGVYSGTYRFPFAYTNRGSVQTPVFHINQLNNRQLFNDEQDQYFYKGTRSVTSEGLPSWKGAWQLDPPEDRAFENTPNRVFFTVPTRDQALYPPYLLRNSDRFERVKFQLWAFKFKTDATVDGYFTISGSSSDGIRIQISEGRIFFTLRFDADLDFNNRDEEFDEIRYKTGLRPGAGDPFFEKVYYEAGLERTVYVESLESLIHKNTIHEICFMADFTTTGRLMLYVDGKRANLTNVRSYEGGRFVDLVPGDQPGKDESSGSYTYFNYGLPEWLEIGTNYHRQFKPDLRGFWYDYPADLLGGLVTSDYVLGDDFAGQRYYDFSDVFDSSKHAAGTTPFASGRKDDDEYSLSDQYIQSSDELNADGSPLTMLDGLRLGASRTLRAEFIDTSNTIDPIYETDDPSNGFDFGESMVWWTGNGFRWEEMPWDVPNHYILDIFTNDYFTAADVSPGTDDWRNGYGLVWSEGLWRPRLVDSTSDIYINNSEPVGTPSTGDMLSWSVIRNGYVSRSPDDDINATLEVVGDVNIELSSRRSNDLLVYRSATQDWTNVRGDYLNYVESLDDVDYGRRRPDTGDILLWNAERRLFELSDSTDRTQTLAGLEDVDGDQFNAGTGWLYYDATSKKWIKQFMSTSNNSSGWNVGELVGEWETYGYADFRLERSIGGAITNLNKGNTYSTFQFNEINQKIESDLPVNFERGGNTVVNSGRGDGGDFNYGEVGLGLTLGIFGGGDFETGSEDLPVEMLSGFSGIDFIANDNVPSPPTAADFTGELPPTYDLVNKRPATPRTVSLLNFDYVDEDDNNRTDYDEAFGGYWELPPDDPTPGSLKPTRPGSSVELNSNLYPRDPSASGTTRIGTMFNTRLNSGTIGRLGGNGLATSLTDDLNLTEGDWTFEFLGEIYGHNFEGTGDTVEAFKALNTGVWVIGSAAEVNNQNAEVGRSWSIRAYDIFPDRTSLVPRVQGFKVEWVTDNDLQKHSISFRFAPGVFAENYNNFTRYKNQHYVFQRNVARGSMIIFAHGQRKEIFHPRIAEKWYDISELSNARISIGVDCQFSPDAGYDFDGSMACARLVKGKCLYGHGALAPFSEFTLSAN